MTLQSILNQKVVTTTPSSTLKETAKLMRENHVGTVLVVDEVNTFKNTPIGIVTDRDIALSLTKQENFDPKSTIKEIMTRNVVMGSFEDGIYQTISKMQQNGVRRLPIIDRNNHLMGIVSSDDLLKLLGEEMIALTKLVSNEKDKEKDTVKPLRNEKLPRYRYQTKL